MTQFSFRFVSRGGTAMRVAAFCFALILGVVTWRTFSHSSMPEPADADVSLRDVEQAVVAIYPVPEITGAEVERMLDRREAVLFDVREQREFDASHLPGAIRVDPNESAERFVVDHGERLKGRVAVFYCAVGLRSAMMMTRLGSVIAPYRPVAAFNLRGGIFRWFAERRAIADANGPATAVDPYDDSWGSLLQRTLDARS